MRSFTLTNGLTLGLILLALLAVPITQARADAYTDGTLTFAVSSGSPIPTGSFVFDDTTNVLTSYTVIWDGTTFPDFPSFLFGDSLSQLTASGYWCAAASNPASFSPGCPVESYYFAIINPSIGTAI